MPYDLSPFEGKQIKGPDGTLYSVKGGQMLDPKGNVHTMPEPPAPPQSDVSTLADVRDSAATGLAQGVTGLLGTPGALTDLAGRGISKVGEWTGSEGLQSAGQGLQQSHVAKKWSPEAWEQTADPYLKALHVDPNYEPQTGIGRYARTGASFLPATLASMVAGPEAMAATLARGAGAAVGSETLGHAVEQATQGPGWESAAARMVGALGGGMMGPRAVTPFPATPARTALANQVQQDIKPYGGKVEASQATGSPTLRLLQGTPKDQSQAATESLFAKAGVPYNKNSTVKLTEELANEKTQLEQHAANLGKTTPVPINNDFWAEYRQAIPLQSGSNTAVDYAKLGLHTTHDADAIKELEAAHQNLHDLLKGSGPKQLSGPEYTNLLGKWNGSSNPIINNMGSALENAANRASPMWEDVNRKFNDIAGLTKAAEKSGADRTINPADVVAGTKKPTPMRDAADSMNKILTPVKKAEPSGLASLATTAAGTGAGLLAGGEGGGVIGLLLAQQGLQGGNRAMQGLFNSRFTAPYLKNQKLLPTGGKGTPVPAGSWGTYTPGIGGALNPKTAAAILSQPAAVLQGQLRGIPQQ